MTTEKVSKSSKAETPFEDPWTKAKLIDAFEIELARAHDYITDQEFGHTLIVAKYYKMADYLMYRIPVYKPVPSFDIDIRDLSPKLKRELIELKRLDPPGFWHVAKMAVACIFENLDFEYFHPNVMRYLRIRFVDGEEQHEWDGVS
jgi:hypothetical protein